MPKPESVEALLSPSLRVSRPVAACSRCRGAKIKCDGKLPACTACEKAGKSDLCSSANDDFARGKERSYVAALESACERLQKRIAAAKTLQVSSEQDQRLLSPKRVMTTKSSSGGRVQRQEASDVDDLVGDFGFLSVNATSRDFLGFTETMSFARLLLTMSTAKQVPRFESRQMPERYYATQLFQRYLENVYVLHPFISETGLMSSLAAVYQDTGRHATVADYWTVRMVMAISTASMAQSKNDPPQQEALSHVSAALEVAEDVIHPGSIAGLQAILLLSQYAMIDAEHFRSWHLIGIASRVLVDLGLHQEPAAETKLSKELLEMRRRVFLCLYCMDRQISMSTNNAFSFTDDSTAVDIPAKDDVGASKRSEVPQQMWFQSMQPSLSLFEIRRIQSLAYQALHQSSREVWPNEVSSNSYIWSILGDVQNWYNSIPATISQRHTVFFKLEFLYTRVFALSPSIAIPNIPDLHKALIFDYSVQFADQMQPVIQDIGWHPFLTHPDIQRMNNIGEVFLEVLWSAYDKILSSQISRPSPISPDPDAPHPPTFTPNTDMLSNVDRALRFLNLTIEVLGYARQRWDDGHMQARFEQEAAVLMGKLRLKQGQIRQQESSERRQVSPPERRPRSHQPYPQAEASNLSQPPRNGQHLPPPPNYAYHPNHHPNQLSQQNSLSSIRLARTPPQASYNDTNSRPQSFHNPQQPNQAQEPR